MKMTKNLVPILKKSEFEDVATRFLEKHYPQAVKVPTAVPIEEIATQIMGLKLRRVHISEDLSVLGQIFFSAGSAEIYLRETDEFICEPVEKGTIFIDPDVVTERNVGSERNTIAHECVHWDIHLPYHMVQVMAGGEKVVAHKCPANQPSEQFNSKWTDEDWMEWQANGIAPIILMPKDAFTNYVEEQPFYHKLKNESGGILSLYYELLIDDLAMFFNVSKQSASIRLTELDLI